jgi:hypothetical protein
VRTAQEQVLTGGQGSSCRLLPSAAPEGSDPVKTSVNRTEPKAQALSWLVSQLRWEETLGDLRHGRDGGDASHAEARQAA